MSEMEQKMTQKNKRIWPVIAGMIAILIIVIVLIVDLIRIMQLENIDAEGQIGLSNIAGNVENNLYRSECLLDSVAMQIEQITADEEQAESKLQAFFNADLITEIGEKSDGSCFSAYAAYKGNLFINDFVPDENFVLSQREWYVGAKRMMGKINISDPYIDANTGDMCYSISKVMPDGETVVGLDFNMTVVQKYIEEMSQSNEGTSLIVNEQGMILGHSNPAYVGKNYQELPFYNELVNKVYMLYGDFFEYRADGVRYNVFSDKTNYDWYLIVCVKRNSSFAGIDLNLAIIVGIMIGFLTVYTVFMIFWCVKKEKAERKLQEYDVYLMTMKDKLTDIIGELGNQLEEINNGEANVATKKEIIQSTAKIGLFVDELRASSNIQRVAREKKKLHKKKKQQDINYGRMILLITAILAVTSVFVIVFNTRTQVSWGNTKMQKESDQYLYQVQKWITSNCATLDVISNSISAQEGFEDDYDYAVSYLDDVVSKYEDISVAYLCNPDWNHTVLMNNRWEPDENWHVENRQWYIDTLESKDGFNIATPYIDEQTGLYCITLSKIVYDKNGDFIGILGIDYYLDKLIDILGASYTDTGYAFLTDIDGNILNHPNEDYQMKPDEFHNATSLCYRFALTGDGVAIIKDYDGTRKVCQAVTEKESGFGIIVVRSISEIYGNAIISDILYLAVFIICIIIIAIIMNHLSNWQTRINRELKETAEHAIRADNAKNDFLARMSHEIRTPINAVLGMNEMIMRESKETEIRDYAVNIQSAGRTLLSLINDILDFSKIESGKLEIIPAQYDISSLINDLVQMTRVRADKKNLEFMVEIDERIPAVLYGDDVRIRQIITNILTNAVKYTASGSVKLKMSLLHIENRSAEIEVSVTDTGMGIREEDMNKLFESFQRIDEQKNRNIEGTGLGITIVQRLLNMMDSELKVSSVYGEGSRFWFTIKQDIVKDEMIGDYEQRFKEASIPSEEEHFYIAPEAHVLIVDDNETNLLVAKSLLKRTQVQIDMAGSGRQGIELLKMNTYDMVFLDHMMPEMDGIETLAEIKKNNLAVHTIFVALTANAIRGAKQSYLDAGFDDYLSKPISGASIENCMFKYLPQNLIKEVEAGSNQSSMTTNTEKMDSEWINLNTGIMYAGGNEESYQEILQVYVSKGIEKLDDIQRFFTEKDWKNYVIAVHALKSSSLSIGAEKLSELAKELELAGKAEQYERIEQSNDTLIELYGKVIAEGKKYLESLPGNTDSSNTDSSETNSKPEDSKSDSNSMDTEELDPVVAEKMHAELIEVLKQLIDACNSFYADDVIGVCDKLESYNRINGDIDEFVEKIKSYVNEFDFEKALDETIKFMEEMK